MINMSGRLEVLNTCNPCQILFKVRESPYHVHYYPRRKSKFLATDINSPSQS